MSAGDSLLCHRSFRKVFLVSDWLTIRVESEAGEFLEKNRKGNADDSLKNSFDYNLDDAMMTSSSEFNPIFVPSEHPLYYLYTSGSTGKPKGLGKVLIGQCDEQFP